MVSENQNNITSLDDILSFHTPEVLATIWIKDSKQSEDKIISYFNYLFDGVLEVQKEQVLNTKNSLFKTHHFGKPFFLSILNGTKEHEKPLKEAFAIINNSQDKENNQKKINVLSKKGSPDPKSMLKQYKEFKFSYYLYE